MMNNERTKKHTKILIAFGGAVKCMEKKPLKMQFKVENEKKQICNAFTKMKDQCEH